MEDPWASHDHDEEDHECPPHINDQQITFEGQGGEVYLLRAYYPIMSFPTASHGVGYEIVHKDNGLVMGRYPH